MDNNNKEAYTFLIDEDLINEFERVVDTISTEDEPFDTEYWLESKMKEFIKQQKEAFSWNGYKDEQ